MVGEKTVERHQTSFRLALLAVTVLAWGIVGWGAASGFPLDDAWIHQVVARNLAATGMPGFVAGTGTGGSTSLLWTFLLAPVHVAGASSPVFYTRVLTLLLWVVAVQALYVLSRRDGWGPAEALVIAAGAALCGNAVWFAWSGMETVLIATLSIVAILGWRCGWVFARDVALAGLALTRPEGLGLAALLAAASGSWRSALRVMMPPLAAALLLAAWSWQATGTPLPTTLGGRRWLFALDDGITPLDVTYYGVQWLIQLWRYLAVRSSLVGLLLAFGVVLGLMTLRHRRATGWGMLCAWTAAMLVIYLPILPRIGHAGRYQPLVLVVVLPLAAMGWLALGTALRPRWGAWVAAAILVVVGARSLVIWNTILVAGTAHIDGTHRAIGRWAGAHLPAGSTVAAFDVGALAWELPGRVVDFSALSDGNLKYLREHRVADLIREQGARYVMLPQPPPGDVNGRALFHLEPDRIALEEVIRRSTPFETWDLGYWSTSHAWSGQVLYRVDPAAEVRQR